MRFFTEELSKKNKIFSENKENYSKWRNELQDINKPFFMIPSDFKHLFLRDISGGALKLFVFLGFHAKYQTGESWYTADQVAAFFQKDPRTVANWFKELEDLGLIFREQKGFKMKATTFLKPYGFRFDEMETSIESTIKDVLVDVEESKKLSYRPVLCLILNYSFREYTLLLIYQDGAEYPCSTFFNFDEEQIKRLRVQLKKYNIPIDNFDVESSIQGSKNRSNAAYTNLLRYLDEQSM
jgi:DNA-binding transcriptional regulator YhcF (GntR family)